MEHLCPAAVDATMNAYLMIDLKSHIGLIMSILVTSYKIVSTEKCSNIVYSPGHV